MKTKEVILTHRNRPEKYNLIVIRDNKFIHNMITEDKVDLVESKLLVESRKTGEVGFAYGWYFKEIENN